LAYTNNGVSGAFRGFGATQVTFGYACFAAELAREAGDDHSGFLERNHLRVGGTTATGQEVKGAGLEVCFRRALTEAGPAPARGDGPLRRGRGIASFLYGIGYGNAIPDIGSAVVGVLPDGGIEVRCGAVDYGQGARTLFQQIAGDVLAVDGPRIAIHTGDTHTTPDSGSTVASRQTVVSGSAVEKAARSFRDHVLGQVADGLALDRETLGLDERGVVADEDVVLAWPELHGQLLAWGARPQRQARYRLRSGRLDLADGHGDAYGTYAFGCQVADVVVDTRTGAVTVERIVAAHDVGRAINPAAVEGQIVGGTCMGLGFALLEEHKIEAGFPVTRNLDTYRLPGPADMPTVVPLVVEEPDGFGPYGARGIGEPAMVATAPAIANAVADALGERVRQLPITPQRVWEILRRAR
ncbi:MAG: molybdopterin-dependent oxidoreductase, partial [Myxococcota bacterium]|nr:molybdopterin-dependent oxidoreductase [Myxococcota bacterium]